MINFKEMTDEKLKDYVEIYELLPMTRTISTFEEYKKARYECYFRFSDDSIQRILFFEQNPDATVSDYEYSINN